MIEPILKKYISDLQATINKGDAREESFYEHLKTMLLAYADETKKKKIDITILPKVTEAGNPDFRVWDGKNHITGYIEAKAPTVFQLDPIAVSPQLKRYISVFANVILTNFYEFRLYQHGTFICSATISRSSVALSLANPSRKVGQLSSIESRNVGQLSSIDQPKTKKSKSGRSAEDSQPTSVWTTEGGYPTVKAPPLEKIDDFTYLLERYFSFCLPAIDNPKSLAKELAKRTRFLRDEIIAIELEEETKQGKKVLLGFYESFKKLLINNLTHEQFADLYAQTLTYGIFAARTKSTGEFNRELIYKLIPNTLGVLKSIFKFISYDEPPQALVVLIDDIAEILCVTDIKKILHAYYKEGKGSDPIIHFYETFLAEYDPKLREKRGVYYTPEPVVRYIVKSIHSILQTHFDKKDGLADFSVTLLDPAAGTLTFPAEAIKLAVQEYSDKYGSGSINKLIKEHILPHFYALELMMAPYTVGHLKISYLLDELGYQMSEDERFKLYLTNTLEKDLPAQIETPFTHEITEECTLANKVKQDEPILVILGNPPYSGMSENCNDWTEQLLKTDIDGATSYYKVDGAPLGEKNPKALQDDYVKFIRFAQWKIHKAGKGIVGMVTNHSYIDNATFRGMRQSLLNTFDEIYVLDLHGNSTKKETAPDGSKDENVFDIRAGVAILLMIKNGKKEKSFYHGDLYGLRSDKYNWLESHSLNTKEYLQITPIEPYYLYKQLDTENAHYYKWLYIKDIFLLSNVGIQTARDNLTIQFDKQKMLNTVNQFATLEAETARQVFDLGKDTRDWKIELAQKDINEAGFSPNNINSILYRPFDLRQTYFTGNCRGFHSMPRTEVMQHMIKDNLALLVGRQGQVIGAEHNWNLSFIANSLVDYNVYYRGGELLFPLYLYPDTHSDDIFASQEKQVNIKPEILDKLLTAYSLSEAGAESGVGQARALNEDTFGQLGTIDLRSKNASAKASRIAVLSCPNETKIETDKSRITALSCPNESLPEQLFYYIYAILYSNIYRERYAEYLRIDFPRVPFTKDYQLFMQLAVYGKAIAGLHLMTSKELDTPIARYQGKGDNDTVEQVTYDEAQGRIYINKDKYFEGVEPSVWNYHIGGYQVLNKYLKDRKGRKMEDPIYYCRIVTALKLTIDYQAKIDELYEGVEKDLIEFGD